MTVRVALDKKKKFTIKKKVKITLSALSETKFFIRRSYYHIPK